MNNLTNPDPKQLAILSGIVREIDERNDVVVATLNIRVPRLSQVDPTDPVAKAYELLRRLKQAHELLYRAENDLQVALEARQEMLPA